MLKIVLNNILYVSYQLLMFIVSCLGKITMHGFSDEYLSQAENYDTNPASIAENPLEINQDLYNWYQK